MDVLQRFNEQATVHTFEGNKFNKRMYLIELMQFSSAEKLGDVDFSRFTVSDLKDTFNDILEYESDEVQDPCYGWGANIGNPIYEINILAGLTSEVLSVKPQRTKKRRFF
jgi:hypothetical protein